MLGSMIMGLSGALTAHYLKFIGAGRHLAARHHLPGLGDAHRRRQRQQSRRHIGADRDLDLVVGDASSSPAACRRNGRSAAAICASSSSACCCRSCCSASRKGMLPEKPPKPVEGDPLLAGRRSPGDGENVG